MVFLFFPILNYILFELGFWYFEKNFWVSNTFATMMQLYRHLVALTANPPRTWLEFLVYSN